MDSMQQLLAGRKYEEPPEVAAIKAYVATTFQAQVQVALKPQSIIVSSPSAALIGTLRLHSVALARAAGTTKRVVFRIG